MNLINYPPRCYLLFLVLAIACFFSASSRAGTALELNDNIKEHVIGQYIELYVDETAKMSFADVQKQRFVPSTADRPNFGFTSAIYWARVTIANHSSQPHWLLQVRYPQMDYIDLYVPLEEGYQVLKTGDLRPFDWRHLENNYFTFPLDLPQKEQTFYLRFQSESAMNLSLYLITPNKLTETVGTFNYFQGAFFGIICAMVLYNLFVFISVRDRAYLYYVCFIFCVGLFQISLHGYTAQFLLADSPWWASRMAMLTVGPAVFFAALFTQSFIQTRIYTPRLHLFLTLIAVATLINSILVLVLSYRVSITISAVLNSICCTAFVYAGVAAFLQGCRQARFYLMAWTVLLVSTVVYALKLLGFIPTNPFIEHIVQFGSVIEAILLSLGLADRINILRDKALAAEQSSNKLKDEFMSTITHELLTPVNGIRLSLDLLKPKLTAEEDKQLHRTAIDSTAQLLNLIESIFTFLESRRGTLSLKPHPVLLKPVFQSVFRYFEKLSINNLKLDFEWDDNLPESVLADDKKLTLIVAQLMKNACLFTTQGSVTLAVKAISENQYRVSITDTGTGIAEQKITGIFAAFQQGDGSFTREHGGLGIGLTIVMDLLKLMDSRLELTSIPGKGTCAAFNLPLIPCSPEQTDPATITPPPTQTAKTEVHPDILVVEDNPVNAKLLSTALSKSGYNPILAKHGLEALEVLNETTSIKAILMDCQMPIMDGYEATREIRKQPAFDKIPIIAVTANVSENDQQRCKECGMDDFVGKPVKKAIIEQVLSRWLAA